MLPRELTAEDRAKSYAKYYYKALPPVRREVLDVLERGPISPDLATRVHDRNDLLKYGSMRNEIGYCVLPDGTGYAAMLTPMPGVTLEMLDWWFMWHAVDGLRYRIWCPTEHFGAKVAPDSLARRLDQALSYRERTWGTTDFVCENVGNGPASIYISFQSPGDYGLDSSLLTSPVAQTAICANAGLAEPQIPVITFMHVAREVDRGIELRSCFWEGWQIIDGSPVNVLSQSGVRVEAVRGCAYHCAVEYTNLASILPELYQENREVIDS